MNQAAPLTFKSFPPCSCLHTETTLLSVTANRWQSPTTPQYPPADGYRGRYRRPNLHTILRFSHRTVRDRMFLGAELCLKFCTMTSSHGGTLRAHVTMCVSFRALCHPHVTLFQDCWMNGVNEKGTRIPRSLRPRIVGPVSCESVVQSSLILLAAHQRHRPLHVDDC